MNILNNILDLLHLRNKTKSLGKSIRKNITDNANMSNYIKEKVLDIARSPQRVNHKDDLGNTALILVCKYYTNNDIIQLLELLINNGADVNIRNNEDKTALICAADHYIWSNKRSFFQHDLLKCLIDQTDISCDKYSSIFVSDLNRSLIKICKYGDERSVELLLNVGANANYTNKYGCTPLMYACQYNKLITVFLLIKYGADVKIIDSYGYSALLYAYKLAASDDILKMLISRGADVNEIIMTENNRTILMDACIKSKISVVKILLEGNCNCDFQDIYGNTALIYVFMAISLDISMNKINSRGIKIAKLLVGNGADIYIKNNQEKSAFDYYQIIKSTHAPNSSTLQNMFDQIEIRINE